MAFMCVGALVVLVATLIGAVVMRAAVVLANRILRPAKPPDTFGQWDDWDSDEPAPVLAREDRSRPVPEPRFTIGMLITFVTGAASAVGYLALAIFAGVVLELRGPGEAIGMALVVLLGVPFTGLTLAVLLMLLLPTTFSRAALVAFLYHLVIVGIGGPVLAVLLM